MEGGGRGTPGRKEGRFYEEESGWHEENEGGDEGSMMRDGNLDRGEEEDHWDKEECEGGGRGRVNRLMREYGRRRGRQGTREQGRKLMREK